MTSKCGSAISWQKIVQHKGDKEICAPVAI